jgi:hypothetical protein
MAQIATVTQEGTVTIELPDAGFPERAQEPLDPVVSPLRNRIERTAATGEVHAWSEEPAPPISPTDSELSLSLTLEVNVVRSKRTRCPRCDNRRVLYHLAAWSKGSPAGTGAALCAECAGFRA